VSDLKVSVSDLVSECDRILKMVITWLKSQIETLQSVVKCIVERPSIPAASTERLAPAVASRFRFCFAKAPTCGRETVHDEQKETRV
jgi:hypothetical protein